MIVSRDDKVIIPLPQVIQITYRRRWHLIAFCRLRNDYRDFRADRITDLTVTDETFDDKRHPAVHTILRKLFADKNLHTAVIRFHKDAPYGIIKKKCFFGFVNQTEYEDGLK